LSEQLTKLGYPSHVVDIGGEVRTGTRKANGEKWRLGVESPLGEIQRVIELTEKSVSTSGNYRNYFEYQGVRYSHTINPATGQPVLNPPASVSVLSDSCMTADGLATGLMVMGIEQGLQFAKQQDLSVLFLDVIDKKRIVEHATGEFLPGVGHAIPFEGTLAVFLLALTATAMVLFRRAWSETSGI
jgi:thiamine biosynthesis lipoprotein